MLKMLKIKSKKIGRWTFLIGFLISIVSAFINDYVSPSIIIPFLVVLGLLTGYLDIDRKNYRDFLIGIIAIVVLGIAGLDLITLIPQINISFKLNPLISRINSIRDNEISISSIIIGCINSRNKIQTK